jgi:alpha/beta superfamily hydrolase
VSGARDGAASRPAQQQLLIPGPAGALQTLVDIPAGLTQPAHFGVVCHPHPLMGGTMDNKVVYTVARAFQECGVPALRFNFRGVGQSEGEFDGGAGETQDALAAAAYGQERWPGATLWLAGFSFGGAVAIRAAQLARCVRLVTVAPALSRTTGPEFSWPECPWLIVHGDADDVVSSSEVQELAGGLPAGTAAPLMRVIPGAGHFFHGRLPELRQTVAQFHKD